MSSSKGQSGKVKGGKVCITCSYRDPDGYCTYINDPQSYLWVSSEATCKFWTSNAEIMRQREEQYKRQQAEREQKEKEELERKAREERERREREELEEKERREREEKERFLKEREKFQEIEGMLEKLSATILDVIDEIIAKECVPPLFEQPPQKKTLIDIVTEYLYANDIENLKTDKENQ